jgi:hypothetical protein
VKKAYQQLESLIQFSLLQERKPLQPRHIMMILTCSLLFMMEQGRSHQ